MVKRRKKTQKHYVCRWCSQDKDRPVRGIPRVGRPVMICPHCRGPA